MREVQKVRDSTATIGTVYYQMISRMRYINPFAILITSLLGLIAE